MEGNLQYLDTLHAQLTNSLDESTRLFVAVSEGDGEAVVQLRLKIFDSQISLLEAENASMRLSNQVLGSDHPLRFLQLAMASGNSANIAMLEAQRQLILNPLASSSDAGHDQIAAGFGWIEAGRTAADEFLVQYSQLPSAAYAIMDQMVDSYHTAFDLEFVFLSVLAELDYTDENDKGFILLPTLANRRLELAADRSIIAEKFLPLIEGR